MRETESLFSETPTQLERFITRIYHRLYRTKEKGGRGLIIWEGCILSEKSNLG